MSLHYLIVIKVIQHHRIVRKHWVVPAKSSKTVACSNSTSRPLGNKLICNSLLQGPALMKTTPLVESLALKAYPAYERFQRYSL